MTSEGLKGIMVVIAIGFAIILIVGLIAGMMLLFGTWTYSFNLLTNSLTSIPSPNNATNISYYSQVTFGNLNSSFQTLRWWAIVIIFSFFFGILVSAFLVRKHPVYFVFYFILLIVAIILSIFISNGYEQVYNSGGALGTELQTSYASSSWIVLYLPEVIVTMGFLGMIILFVSYSYGQDDLGGAF